MHTNLALAASNMSVLSKPDILKHLRYGNIVIEPFEKKNLANTSYDVRLGENYYRQNPMDHTQTLNPYWKKSVDKMYSNSLKAEPVTRYISKKNPFNNFSKKDLIILIAPNETILGHTIEFVGGKNGVSTKGLGAVTTTMRARSSVGRVGITVCKCAGWGDIGFINRWTMEITNFSNSIIPLRVGMRIAQIIFNEVTAIEDTDSYHKSGKYQKYINLSKIRKSWKPELMLPRLYDDWDAKILSKYQK